MKVLEITPWIEREMGGVPVAVWQTTDALVRLGFEVDLATTVPRSMAGDAGPLPTRARVWRFPRHDLGSWAFSWPLRRWLRAHVGTYDLIYVHNMWLFPTWVGSRLALKNRVPYILQTHGQLSDWCLRHKGWKKAPYYRLIERATLAGAAAIRVTSAREAQEIGALGFADKVRSVPMAIDLPRRSDREPPSADPSAPLRLLYLSRLHPSKGVVVLLRAVAQLKREDCRIHLTIAGSGSSDYQRELERCVDELAIADAVAFIGWVEGSRKAELFRTHDVFILPSFSDSFAIAVLEAMGAGMPVILTDAVGTAADVSESEGGRVVPVNDANALAQAIRSYVDGAVRTDAGARGRSFVVRKYDQQAADRELEALCRDTARRTAIGAGA